uniref:Uncharacterized protein n=1 Tax=Kalanchoe fedtschenkoi TaxID=63787 RepID=A0A7N0ZVB5_KALFE
MMGFTKSRLSVTYLGVPLTSKRLVIKDFESVIDKILTRINSWTSKVLSYAGRLTLVKSILATMANYQARLFIFPKAVTEVIEGKYKTYLWAGKGESKRSPVSWDKICEPKKKGGLAIRKFTYNAALILAQVWDIILLKESLWVQWLHTYFLKGMTVEVQWHHLCWNKNSPQNIPSSKCTNLFAESVCRALKDKNNK